MTEMNICKKDCMIYKTENIIAFSKIFDPSKNIFADPDLYINKDWM